MSLLNYGYAERHYDKRLATAYTIYMIVGSYYKRCSFSNKMEETHLKMHYVTMKERDQIRLEKRIDDAALKLMDTKKMSRHICTVRSYIYKDIYYLRFISETCSYEIAMYPKGKIKISRIM